MGSLWDHRSFDAVQTALQGTSLCADEGWESIIDSIDCGPRSSIPPYRSRAPGAQRDTSFRTCGLCRGGRLPAATAPHYTRTVHQICTNGTPMGWSGLQTSSRLHRVPTGAKRHRGTGSRPLSPHRSTADFFTELGTRNAKYAATTGDGRVRAADTRATSMGRATGVLVAWHA